MTGKFFEIIYFNQISVNRKNYSKVHKVKKKLGKQKEVI